MQVHTLVVSPFAENCYLLTCPETSQTLIVDAGDQAEDILRHLQQKKLKAVGLVNTHCHVDHVSAVAALQEALGIPFFAHPEEQMILDSLLATQSFYGFGDGKTPKIDQPLREGQVIPFGNQKIKVIETPGHTPGGISLLGPGCVFAGDSLFAGSIGRTDLPGGNMDQLLRSIQSRLMTLPEDLTVYSGHGPTTSIGQEKRYNPFLG